PEEKLKEIGKIRQEIIKQIDSVKQNIWLHIKTPVDIFELCLDSKFELAGAIAMSYPLHDKGILGALRVAEIHKSLVLQKFEKYVVSYVIAGSLVRGEAVKTSDVDIFIVINDTDVKRMPRLELKERLRSIIFQYIGEASALAGVKNKLSPQVYLLTEFWESVKDANPVIFTFIRDGIPLYDRGTFMPWKALLKMGKLKPSPEAIDMFMSMGDKTVKRAKAALLDILIHDIYWGVITPSQALLMLYGLPPPTPKQTVAEIKKVFVDKEKMLEKKYLDILEKIVGLYKDYEHEKLKEIKGAEIDKLTDDTEDYLKRLKELREQIEKRAQERTIEQIYKDVFDLLGNILGKNSQEKMVKVFEKELIKTGKLPQQSLRTLKNVIDARAEFKKGKSNSHKIDEARKTATLLINDLVDFSQRKDLMEIEKTRMRLKYSEDNKPKMAELIVSDGESFLVREGRIKKITDKLEDSNTDELSKSIQNRKGKQNFEINPKVFDLLKKELGEFKIVL
ncbi:MAG: nucleotidyltransferase domain-containing protein, partial [Nanoarchaeota archaeon]|nr:nucleotidyltransferase domain-containing protein [Nanoarchaeota archaeon]